MPTRATAKTHLPSRILRMRDHRWRRTRARRLRTPAEARRFVRTVGFCLFWPTEGIEMPNLLHAIAGNARPLAAGYNDASIGKSWSWKDEALDKRWWYYGKLLRRRSTLVSLDLLPAFYALSENYGDPQDYVMEYHEGRLSAEAKAVLEALMENGPLDTIRLRQAARLANPQVKARFDRAVVDLQAGLKVLPVGVAEAGAWNYAFVYDLVDRWFPDLDARARRLTTRQAREAIAHGMVQNLVAATAADLRRSLGWSIREIDRTLEGLVEAGSLRRMAQGTAVYFAAARSAGAVERALRRKATRRASTQRTSLRRGRR